MTGLIRKFSQVIDLISRGDVGRACDDKLSELLDALEAAPGDKVSGEMTVKLKFNYELGRVDVVAKVDSKLPDTTRFMKTPFWIDEGRLSVEHPNQTSMFGGPAGVKDNFGDDDDEAVNG